MSSLATNHLAGGPAEILVTGGSGQLGHALCQLAGSRAIGLSRTACDLADRAQLQDVVRRVAPRLIVNCAAYTMVDKAEEETERCWQVNAHGVRWLAEAANEVGAKLIHISTDYVFGNDLPSPARPWTEDDPPIARGVYAQSKLAGEQEAGNCAQHLIVRTCGLYGLAPQSRNFVATMLRLAGQCTAVRVVDDQHCTPTYASDLAEALLFLDSAGTTGIVHVVNSGSTTWCQFAREIFLQAQLRIDVVPITSGEYDAAAPRPSYSVLDTAYYHSLRGPTMRRWQAALTAYLDHRVALPRK